MSIRVLVLALLLVILLIGGCSNLLSRIQNKGGNVSGTLVEQKDDDNNVKRLTVQKAPGWRSWDQNAIKGSGDGLVLQGEMTF